MIHVRRATILDKPAIFEFLKLAYGEAGLCKFPERWEWQFENNPFKPNDQIPVFIAVTEDGQVIGQSAAMYELLKVGTDQLILTWALDAIILPEYRGKNLGFETLQLNCESSDLWMGMIMATSSRHILTKLGCKEVDKVHSYRRVAFFDADSVSLGFAHRSGMQKIDSLLRKIRVNEAVSRVINALIGIQDCLLNLTIAKSIDIEECENVGEEFDQFWERIQQEYPVIIQRNSQFLKWKYLEQPHVQYRFLKASRANKMCGYLIFRCAKPPESNSGIIADILTHPDDQATKKALLANALDRFKSEKVKYVYAASSMTSYQQAFNALGFRKKKVITPLLHSKLDEQTAAPLFKHGNWFLGRSDHDWDQYPYA